jgi:hypothetical protein
MVPRLQLRLSIPILIAFVGAGIVAVIAHYRWPEARKTIEFGAALLGGGTAIYALLLNVQARRASAAAGFITRWNEPNFDIYRRELGQAVAANSIEGCDLDLIRASLNFFEEMGIAVIRREADEAILKDFFWTVVLTFFRSTRPWIEKRRIEKNQPTGFSNFEELYKRWEPNRVH